MRYSHDCKFKYLLGTIIIEYPPRLQNWALFDEISGAENLENPGAGAQIGRRAHLGARVGAAVTRAVDVLQAVCMITIIDKLQDSNITQSLAYNIDCKNFARCEYIMRFILSERAARRHRVSKVVDKLSSTQ